MTTCDCTVPSQPSQPRSLAAHVFILRTIMLIRAFDQNALSSRLYTYTREENEERRNEGTNERRNDGRKEESGRGKPRGEMIADRSLRFCGYHTSFNTLRTLKADLSADKFSSRHSVMYLGKMSADDRIVAPNRSIETRCRGVNG